MTDQPCKAGETGRVVLTVLHNFRTPFIRYEIGDMATLAPEPCRCGRGLPLLTRVQGKVRPHFKLDGGRRKHSSDLVHAITTVGGHHQHQVIQKALDQVIVRIVPNVAWTADHKQRLIQAVRLFFEAPVSVQLEPQGAIGTFARRQTAEHGLRSVDLSMGMTTVDLARCPRVPFRESGSVLGTPCMCSC